MAGQITSPLLASDDVARRIKAELEVAYGRGHSNGQLAKVTSLLHAFRTESRATDIGSVKKVLQEAGVVLAKRPGVDRFDRTGVVALTLEVPPTDPPVFHGHREIRLSTWQAGIAPTPEIALNAFPPASPQQDGAINWLDVESATAPVPTAGTEAEQSASAGDDLDRQAERLQGALADWCPGLTLEMAHDLVRPDLRALPRLDTYGDEEGPRSLSVVAAVARGPLSGPDESEAGGASLTGAVILQTVQMLVGKGWIVTCWPATRTVGGGDETRLDAPLLRQPFVSRVHYLSSQLPQRNVLRGNDLGLLLAQALVETYGATHRMMQAWLADWELAFYSRLGKQDLNDLQRTSRDLDALLAPVAEVRRRVTGLQHAQGESRDRSWLGPTGSSHEQSASPGDPHVLATQLEKDLARHDTALQNQIEAIRADMDVVVMRSAAAQQATSDALQRNLGLLTSLVLAPTLIVGFFGANTALPGGASWWGFTYMVVSMVVSVLVALLIWRRRELPNWLTRKRSDRHRDRAQELPKHGTTP